MAGKTAAQHKIFAQRVAAGDSLKQSMLSAGYSPKQASKGMAAVSQKMLGAMKAEGCKIADFGKSFSLDELRNVVIGRLATNSIIGRDGGVMSAKTLGSMKDLQLFQPDSQVGVVVLNTPQKISEKIDKLLTAEE